AGKDREVTARRQGKASFVPEIRCVVPVRRQNVVPVLCHGRRLLCHRLGGTVACIFERNRQLPQVHISQNTPGRRATGACGFRGAALFLRRSLSSCSVDSSFSPVTDKR